MNQKALGVVACLILTTGCEESSPSLNAALQSAEVVAPATQLALKTSLQTWPNLCTLVKVELQNSYSKAVEALEDTPIAVAALHVTFYIKGRFAGSGDLKAESTKLAGASLSLTVGDPNTDLVLGQPDFMTNTANLGGLSGHSLNSPMTPSSDGKNLFVADGSNNRILIWKTLNPVLGSHADIVLGQPDFYSNTQDGTKVSA